MTVHDKRQYLRNLVTVEDNVLNMKRTLEHEEACKALLLLDYAIPCILHMENRCGEKIVTLLLNEMMRKGYELDEAQRISLIERTEKFINANITGDEAVSGQWRIPLSDDKKSLASVTMSNPVARNFMNKLDALVVEILNKEPDRERKNMWLKALEQYRQVMIFARRREEFTDEDIEIFQCQCDLFYDTWIALHGTVGVTNYMHMLGAGHLLYYLKRYRNLYRYSQQGWEAVNKKIKLFFFNDTQHGGYVKVKKGQEQLPRNYIKPIARGLLRDVMWKTMLGYKFFFMARTAVSMTAL